MTSHDNAQWRADMNPDVPWGWEMLAYLGPKYVYVSVKLYTLVLII